jgi:hypothetical protein
MSDDGDKVCEERSWISDHVHTVTRCNRRRRVAIDERSVCFDEKRAPFSKIDDKDVVLN